MGELPMMLAAADIAFVGGSLIARGGHNLLEPAALGKPVLTGPSTFNFAEIYQRLLEQQALITVHDSAALADTLSSLFCDKDARLQLGQNALAVVNNNKGAIHKTLQRIESFI